MLAVSASPGALDDHGRPRPAARARVKRYRETPAEWYTYFGDGTRQEIFVSHRATVTSAFVRRP
jgi:hypothetical protein